MGKITIRLTKKEHKFMLHNMLKVYTMETWANDVTKKYKIKDEDKHPPMESLISIIEVVYLMDKDLYKKIMKLTPTEGLRAIIEYVTDEEVKPETKLEKVE